MPPPSTKGSPFFHFGGFMSFIKNNFNQLYTWFYSKKLNRILSKVQQCSTFFGMPGTGKTTFFAKIVYLCIRAGKKVYCNVPIKGAIEFSKSDFGRYDMSDSVILIDEGSLFYDGRNFSTNFNQNSLEYLKLLRHRRNNLFICSQSLDIDVKFIRMSNNIFQIKKGLFNTSRVSMVRRKVDIDENTHKFDDFYYKLPRFIAFFSDIRVFRPKYYKMFDSYSAPNLPKMEEKIYGE